MNQRLICSGIVLLCWSWLAACEHDDSPRPLTARTPVAVEGALLYLDETGASGEALLVDLTTKAPRITVHPLPPGEVKGVERPGSGGREALVLTSGTESRVVDGKVEEGVNSHLLLFDRNGEVFRTDLAGRFGKLAVSEDGRTVVAHGKQQGIGVGNAVAIVDLAAPNVAARILTLDDNTGRAVESFTFPRLTEAFSRRLMLAGGVDTLMLLELDHLDRAPKEIPLKLPNDSRSLRVGKVLFERDEIFIQIQGSSDVLLLQLSPNQDGDDTFSVSPLYLPTSSSVQDIELVGEGSERRLLAVGQGNITVIDPVTGDGVSERANAAFSNLIPFAGRSPVDDQVRERGLLVAEPGQTIAFFDLDDGSDWSQQSLEVLTLPDVVEQTIPLLDHLLVLLRYRLGGMGIVDLENRKVTPVDTGSHITSSLLDTENGEAHLWLNLENGRVARIDLLRLEAREVLLNAKATDLVLIEGEPRFLAALHDSSSGFITLLDPETPSREDARELVSFFYSEILD